MNAIADTPPARPAAERRIRRLTLIYDSSCLFCLRCATWLARQPKFIPLEIIARKSRQAQTRYPALVSRHAPADLAVVADEGAVYLESKALVMCLYALVHYRSWALRLSGGRSYAVVRTAFSNLSHSRMTISKWLAWLDYLLGVEEYVDEGEMPGPPICRPASPGDDCPNCEGKPA